MAQPFKSLARSNWITALVFLPPALTVFTIFVIMPVGEAAWYSFYNWDGYGTPSQFNGLRNYVSVLTNATFLRALLNNGWIILASLVVQLPLALGKGAHAPGGVADRNVELRQQLGGASVEAGP